MKENGLYFLIFFMSTKQDLVFVCVCVVFCIYIPVNNVGMLPSVIPCRFLDSADLDQVSGTSAVSHFLPHKTSAKTIFKNFKSSIV